MGLDGVALVIACEDRFGIEIEDREADLPAGALVLDVRNGWLAALELDEYDVETISLYRVIRN